MKILIVQHSGVIGGAGVSLPNAAVFQDAGHLA
jgi:hypothetical protein